MRKAFEYLLATNKIRGVGNMADKMNRSRESVSRAINGSETYLNEKFITALTATFPILSKDWLLNGNGTMVVHKNIATYGQEQQYTSNVPAGDTPAMPSAEMLRLQEYEELRLVRFELQQARDDFRQATNELRNILATYKDEDKTKKNKQ